MSRLALVSAMHEELAAVLARMPDERKTVVAGREFWIGHWHGHEVVAVLSRIGKVAAATTATVLIERFGVNRMVFTGVAGGLAEQVRVGDVVVANQFVQHDMDASPLFPRYEVPLTGITHFPADPVLRDALLAAAPLAIQDLVQTLPREQWLHIDFEQACVHQGLVVSGDRFVSQSAESIELQQRLPNALAVEMEGAALAQVCHAYGIPLAVVRTLSDRADDDAHTDFVRFVKDVASPYSAAIVSTFLKRLPKV
jgi:adenosylhomocysteine nucleosidase